LVESIIHQKFGASSARIFRLLGMKKQLEQKQVGDLAMIPPAETRERLYRLLAGNYVHLQEVPKSSDHAPSRTFYLWGVKYDKVTEALLEEMYKTIRNLKIRLQHHLQQSQDIIQKKAEEIQAHKGMSLSEHEKESLERVQNIEDQLENSIIYIDQCILILSF